jgi:tetratricopeptide (TPR) repeat protein
MKERPLKILGNVLLIVFILHSPASVWAQAAFRARLFTAGGLGGAANVEIDIESYSTEDEILRLHQHFSLNDLDGFYGALRSMKKGALRFIGSSGLNIPFNAALKRPTDQGTQIFLLTESQDIVPGVTKTRIRRSRFLVVVLDLDKDLKGEGTIYEDAQVKFTRQDIEIVSSYSMPKKLGNVHPLKAALISSQPAASKGGNQVERALGCMDFMLYEEAISLFDQALAKNPAQPGLRTKQAYAYYRLNRPEKAVEALNQELEDYPDDLKTLILLSFIQHKTGHPDEAERAARKFEDVLEKLLKKKESEYLASKQLDVISQLRDYRKKIETIMRGLFPNTGVPAYILGLLAKKKQNIRAARSWLIRAKELSYDPSDCWIQAIDSEIEQKNWPEALRLCQTEGDISFADEAKTSPDRKTKPTVPASKKKIKAKISADIYLLMGIIYGQQGRLTDSLECMKMAVALKPFDANVLKNLAIGYINCEDLEKATRLLQRVVKLSPQDFQSQLLLDQVQQKKRIPEGAPRVALSKDFLNERDVRFQYVFEGDSDEIANKANVNAVQLIKEGLVLDATRWLQMFVEIYQNSPTIDYNLGQLYNSLGHYAEALKYGIKALELKRDYRDAYDLAGNVCFKVGDLENSVKLYEEAVRLDTKDPMSYYNLGCASSELGDLANAEKNWLEAIRLENAPAVGSEASNPGTDVLKIAVRVKVEPISAPACQSLAYLYARQCNKENAFAYFKKAIEFNPGTPTPYFEIGKLYLERNEAGKAQEYFKKYVSLGGDEAKVKALMKK